MWKHVFDNVDMRVRWNGNTYLMTWIHVFDNVDMCVRWNGNTFLMTWIYVFDNARIRARWICPYAWRSVRTHFVGERWYFTECSPRISWSVLCVFRGCSWVFHGVFVALWQSVRSRRGRFIVPAYTYTPTKWQTEMRVRWCGNVYLIMWKHVFDNVDMLERFTINRRIP